MKNRKGLWLLILIIAFILSACKEEPTDEREEIPQGNDPITNQMEGGSDVLVWRIATPGADSKEAIAPLISMWQGRINTLLDKNGADYSVRIETYGFTDNVASKAMQAAEELEELRELGTQTDVISVLPQMQDVDLSEYRLAYLECVKKNLLMPLDTLLNTQKGEALQKAIPAKDLERAKMHGVTYGLSSVLPPMQAVLYSDQQMEQYGVAAEELEGSIFTKESILQTIKNLTGEASYGVHSGDVRRKLGLWIVDPTNNLVLNTEGKFVNVTETQEFRDYLEKLIDWKKKGLVKVLGGAQNQKKEMLFAQDMGESNYCDQSYQTILNVEMGDGTQKETSVLVVPDENEPVLAPYWGDNKLCIAAWTKKQEQAEDFLVKLLTDSEIANIIQYGTEGQDYTLNETILETESAANIFLRYFGYQYTNPIITYSTATMPQEKQAYVERFHKTYGKEIPDGFRFDPTTVLTQITETNNVFGDAGGSETARKIVALEVEDVDQAIEKITQELKEAGIDAVVEEGNRQLSEWKKGEKS